MFTFSYFNKQNSFPIALWSATHGESSGVTYHHFLFTTGLSGGGSILPSNPNLPPKHCSQSPAASVRRVSGSICDSTIRFRRMAWNNPLPSSLLYRDALLSNEHGTSYVPWRFMRLTHDQGWMSTIILGQNYNFSFDNAPQLTNISYR